MQEIGHAVNENIKDRIKTTFPFDGLDATSQDDLMSLLIRIVFQSVLLRVIPMLEAEDLSIYEQMIEKGGSTDEITGFFVSIIPQFESIVFEEIQIISNILIREDPEALKALEKEKKIDDLRTVLMQKFS